MIEPTPPNPERFPSLGLGVQCIAHPARLHFRPSCVTCLPRRDPLHILTVAKPYVEGKTQWPAAVEYDYACGAHELRLLIPYLRPPEIAAVASGPARLAFAHRGDAIYFC